MKRTRKRKKLKMKSKKRTIRMAIVVRIM